ncbi:VOC family protein [Pengzhenrongella frigida]|uniref:VOC family protein n=1 Tax=Pengzhenrongella frigida TaxID=1259133 RepID=A0A4Q5N3P1_9MICO|nr:VOC family protein [Cellulomonas sp. HLT2-17]RYV52786.1 VOC family protein [Cellulomonas sp. HLT2-17]
MPTWITAFLDATPDRWDVARAFWTSVTGYGLSSHRGADQQFVTLVPTEGDAFLRLQRLDSGPARIHLDLHVPDPRAAADGAVALGATELDDLGHVVMASPGGLTFCFVGPDGSHRPPATRWPGVGAGEGHSSLVDQVALDIPMEHWARETRFWSELTGWAARPSTDEFSPLERPADQPLRLLPHRLEEPTGAVRAHLDLATSDRAAETARHVALGAAVERVTDEWTVLRGPDGSRYCVTDRSP